MAKTALLSLLPSYVRLWIVLAMSKRLRAQRPPRAPRPATVSRITKTPGEWGKMLRKVHHLQVWGL
jgi:hypothetical protein